MEIKNLNEKTLEDLQKNLVDQWYKLELMQTDPTVSGHDCWQQHCVLLDAGFETILKDYMDKGLEKQMQDFSDWWLFELHTELNNDIDVDPLYKEVENYLFDNDILEKFE